MRKNNAFTLIELLVVIAIIAILAAILFPVFAQAKAAAKNIKTVSNMKQIGTSQQLYLADYDDVYQQAGTMNGNGASWGTGACNAQQGCPSWDSLLMPYMKSFEMFSSDFDRAPRTLSPWGQHKRSFRAAANVINGWAGVNTWDGGDYGFTPLNATAVPAVASTILFTEQRNAASVSCTWWAGAAFFECGVWNARSSNTLANDDPIAVGSSTGLEAYASGIDFGSRNRANYVFADTHTKSHAKGYIFPGYEQRRAAGQPIDTTLKGVCLDAGPFGRSATDCPLPPQ
ncbi:MAG: prepilin-type N-terminal cleavage/methylation domain-containing protein [Armatimonadetes bacterium]|nr:prepilin-type N-terminal cleavage/methylation domain-containing protein [Armatimonadota bacterium]